jgi:RNA polymerase sigma-70 factor (ECF subfamily)
VNPDECSACMPLDLGCDPVTTAYASYVHELRGFATARLRSIVAAEDVVQESFLRLAVEADAGRFPRQPRAWLYRVTLNLIISGARSAQRANAAGALGLLGPREPVDFDTPEARWLALERRQRVGAAMASVAPRARTGLLMAAEGYSGREIAAAIGTTEVATRALMFRARSQVRRSLSLAEAI